MPCQCFLVSAGYFAVAVFTYKVLSALYNVLYPYVVGSPISLRAKAGADWAVITGATDGIGKAYAFELARKGFNIYLVSRTQAKLDEVEKEIREKHDQVNVKKFAFDFCAGCVDAYNGLLNALNEIEVGILVNNVGMGYEYPEVLHEIDGGLQRVGAIMTVNTLPTTVLCAHIIKQMVPRNSGIIINVASASSYNLMPLWAVYSAAKKYVVWLSETLRMEYSHAGLTIQTVNPMMVATKMSKVRKTSFFIPSAEKFVQSAVRSIGLADETTGHLSHQLQVELMRFAPSFLLNKVLTEYSLATRRAALKKKAKLQ